MKLLKVIESPKPDKKLRAVFCKCPNGKSVCKDKDRLKIDFGQKGSHTYAEGADLATKENYLKRHKVNEDWDKINAGSLSAIILWSAKSIEQGIKNFKKRFQV